jgi:Active DUF488-N3 subclade
VRLHTASYSAWSRRPEGYQPVVCSLLLPKWLPEAEEFPRLWAATPRWSYWRSGWPDEFRGHFEAQLGQYGARRIARQLHQIARDAGAERLVLLCFEADPGQCHRSLFAGWWLHTVGERITEIT